MKEAERPFKLPGGTAVAAMACIPPLVICLATLGANLMEAIHAAAFGCALMVGIVGATGQYPPDSDAVGGAADGQTTRAAPTLLA